MSATTIRGIQLRDGTISRAKIDAAFESSFAQVQADIATIYNTMSTDQERLDAIAAVTTAWQNADSSLQSAITSLVNATKAGAGLEADGSFVLPAGQNYLTGATSLKGAIALLDAALNTEAVARAAAISALQASVQTLIDNGASNTQALIDAEAAARVAGDATNAAAISAETTARQNAVTDLQTQVDNEVTARELLNTTLSASIAAEATARTAAVSAEASTRAAADTALQNSIDAEALARTNADATHTAAIAAEEAARIAAVASEASTRAAADTALDTRVTSLETASANVLTYAKVIKREVPTGLINGSNTLFELAYDPVAGTEEVYVNGQLMDEGATADYTINGKEITLAIVLEGTDKIRVNYFR